MNLWEEINDNIEDEEEFQNELSQSLQFEEKVKFQLKQKNLFLKTKKFLLSIKQVQAMPGMVANIQAMLSYLKLRKKKFSGDPTNWKAFIESFNAAIHSNPHLLNIEKMNYLVNLLVGEAETAVE